MPRRRVLLAMLVVVAMAASVVPAVAAASDTDRDGLPDTFERTMTLTDPRRADTDRDGLKDGSEDPDHDSLTNRQEYIAQTHPRRADTDRDGIRDDREDPDRDWLQNRTEFLAGTHPLRMDTDRDGLPDGSEDPDRDGLTNRQEQSRGTLPRNADTDGDGYPDGEEAIAGTNPKDAESHPVAPSAGGPTVPGANCSIFPMTNVWNVPIDGRGVAADSATLIAMIGLDRGLHMDFGSYAGYGIPYQVVSAATARSTVVFDYADESDRVGYPIPGSPFIEGGSDRHLLMVDRDACRLFELYAARKVGSTWHAGSGATWDLGSNALRPAGWTSADAAGLPILPGLVRYDEVVAGTIGHALRFTTNRTRTSYIYPARHQAGESSAASLPPMGLRVRLKASVGISGLSPTARAIAQALKTYGMILADNGSPWYVTGASDPRFDDDVLHELDVITGRDLEVVDTSGLVNGP